MVEQRPTVTDADVPTGLWTVDPNHTVVGFSVRYLMSRVRGRFTDFDASITVATDHSQSSVHAEIRMASVDTGNEMRDGHLRSGDFFDVGNHPTMTFASTAVRAAGDRWTVDGDLTIRGTVRPVTLDVEFLGYDPTGAQGERRIGFEARTSIRRSDFGVTFGLAEGGKLVIADRIDILLDVQAVHAG